MMLVETTSCPAWLQVSALSLRRVLDLEAVDCHELACHVSVTSSS